MKVFVFLLLAVSATYIDAASVTIPPSQNCHREKGGLGEVFQDLFKLVDLDALLDELFMSVLYDDTVREFVNYLSSPEFNKLIDVLRYNEDFINILEFLCEDLYLDAYMYLNALGEVLGIRPITRPPRKYSEPDYQLGGVRGFMNRIIDLLPVDAMGDFWYKSASTNPYVCKFYRKMGTKEVIAMTERIEADPAFKDFLNVLISYDLDAHLAVKWLKGFLWERDYCN